VPLQQLVEAGDQAMAEALTSAEAVALDVELAADQWIVAEGVPLQSHDPACGSYQRRRRTAAVAAGGMNAVFAPGVPFGVGTGGFTRAVSVSVIFALPVAPTDLFVGCAGVVGREVPTRETSVPEVLAAN
jgi:hypothetical protein